MPPSLAAHCASRTAGCVRFRPRGRRPDSPGPGVTRSLLFERRERAQSDELTEREREVLELIRQGLPNKSIGRRLGISERTVKAHVTHILQRLGVPDRTQAALWAERQLRPVA